MMWKTQPRFELTQKLYGWRGGAGPAMLLLHGVGMRADFWSHLVPELAKRFTVTTLDLPGHGHSPRILVAEPSLADYTDTVAEFLSEQNEPSFVVGHSMGAMIALDLAARYKETVAGIGVLNGVYRRSPEALSAIQDRVKELSSMNRTDSVSTLARWFGDEPIGIDRQACEACQRWLEIADQEGYRKAYRAFAHGDAPADSILRSIRTTALFMTGTLEFNSTAAMSIAMSEKMPDSRCVIVENARHMLPMTHGKELVCELISRFSTAAAKTARSTNE